MGNYTLQASLFQTPVGFETASNNRFVQKSPVSEQIPLRTAISQPKWREIARPVR
jgi:hypothetical protein